MAGYEDPDEVRAVIMLRAACDTALERFDDDIDDLSAAVRITELRETLDGYLADAGQRIAARNGRRPATSERAARRHRVKGVTRLAGIQSAFDGDDAERAELVTRRSGGDEVGEQGSPVAGSRSSPAASTSRARSGIALREASAVDLLSPGG